MRCKIVRAQKLTCHSFMKSIKSKKKKSKKRVSFYIIVQRGTTEICKAIYLYMQLRLRVVFATTLGQVCCSRIINQFMKQAKVILGFSQLFFIYLKQFNILYRFVALDFLLYLKQFSPLAISLSHFSFCDVLI